MQSMPITTNVVSSIRARCITLCDEVCEWLSAGRWFSPGTPVSSTNQTNRYDITEILLKEVLTTTKPQTKPYPIMLKRKCNSRMNKCYKLCLFNVSILYNICRFQDYLFHCQLTNPVHLSVYVLIADTMTFLLFVLLFS